MDALEALCNGFKFEEIIKNIDDLPALYHNEAKESKHGEKYCTGCELEQKKKDGLYICEECGKEYGSVMVNEWVDNIWMHRKKSVYIRSHNIISRMKKYVNHSHLWSVFEDFLKVVDTMTKHRLIKKNISR